MGFRMKDLAFLDDKQADKLSNVTVESGDVLLNITGASVARCCIVPDDVLPARVNQHVSIIRLVKDEMSPEFLHYALISNEYKDSLLKTGEKGGSTRQAITKAQIEDFSIKYPPLPEQQRIVSVLDEAFASIAQAESNAEQNLVNARELFEVVSNEIFESVRNKWEEKRLDEVYDVRDGTHYSPKFRPTGYPFVTSKNLKNGELNFDKIQYISEKDYNEYNKRSKVDKGDILFAMIGTLGNPVVVEVEPDFAIKNVALIKVPENQSNYFLKYYLNSKFVVEKFYRDARGTTQKFVGLGNLRKFTIPLPPLAEQRAIVGRLEALSAETKRLEEIYQSKVDALDELKKSVLGKAFAGEL